MIVLDTLIQGALLGGLYALFALGLSLAYGVMRLVNLAHGDFIVLAAYLALLMTSVFGVSPFVVLPIVVLAMAALGYGLQRGIFNRTLGADILPALLVTFGLSVVVQNSLLQLFSADSRSLQIGNLATASVRLTDELAIGWFPLIIFGVAAALTAALEWLFNRTTLGIAFRATADDPRTACLVGIDARHVYALAMSLSFAIIAIAGVFAGIKTIFTPDLGPSF